MRLIDADALKESIHCSDTDEKQVLSPKQLHKILDEWIDERPTIEPMRKKGKWIDTGSMEEWWAEEFMCSECGWSMLGTANFCPNCGSYNGGDNNG